MQYIPTDLPQYWKIHPRSDFSNALIEDGHVLLFSQDGQSITAKKSDGTYEVLSGSNSSMPSAELQAGVLVNDNGVLKVQPLKFDGTIPSDSGSLQEYDLKIFNTGRDEPDYGGSAPVASMDFYKCTSVNTTNKTWTGYLGTTNQDGTTVFASEITTLSYSVFPPPVVGKCYTGDGLNEVIVFEAVGTDVLVFYAPLHEAASNAYTGQSLTTSGTVDYSSGHAYFSGNGSGGGLAYISFSDTGFPSGSSSRTISFLANPQQDNAYHTFRYGTYITGSMAAYRIGICSQNPNNRVEVAVSGDTVEWSSVVLSGLHHYVITYDGTNEELWVDGVSKGTKSQSFNTVLTGTAYIAYGYNSPEYTGYLSELKIWTRKLTSDEITAEYSRLQSMLS